MPESSDPAELAGTAPPAEPGADLLRSLNPAQREAVTHGEGPLLILAGAGSGKTRVIAHRIAFSIRERGVEPGEVLAITFTNKAAGEMRSRVEALLPARGAWISTFHSMCARILRRDIEALGGYTRDFSIYDTADRNQLLKELIQRAGYDPVRFRPAALGAWISQRKNGRDPARGGPAAQGEDPGGIEHELFKRVEADYQRALQQANAVDFDDLLLLVLALYERHPGIRDGYARRFRQVLVDEYQDTNRVQYLLMRHLAGFHGNVAVCGDPDQSIYAWRGADVRNILAFEEDFPGARVVRLEQNYRSCGNVLAAAQALIRHNRERKEKELWSDKGAGAPLVVVECADEDDEASEIALQIRALAAGGMPCDAIAIFYRANFMQRALERALRMASIPYQVVAGTEFFQRREIKDLIAYLRLAVNPADDSACRRAIQAPARGIGEKSLDAMERWAQDRRLPLARACASREARAQVRGKARAGLEAFAGTLERLQALREAPAAAALETVIAETSYLSWVDSLRGSDEVDRAANVEELLANARTYDRDNPGAGVRGFLQDVALVSETDAYDERAPRVALMTLHAAKGLEFDAVFVAGLEEELLPHARALADDQARGGSALEEERRLFYVGMTRARERLFLTYTRVRLHFGFQKPVERSRFLDEIPEDLIEGAGEPGPAPARTWGDLGSASWPEPAILKPGDWVEHDHFGLGRVESTAGSGANARATIAFGAQGTRQLLLQYARLRSVPAGGKARR
jgi:DNA helicase-2/ATP-dependent DNA helicase PcrA